MKRSNPPSQGAFRCAIYVRISDDREGKELGVQRQEEACLALAKRQGWEVVPKSSEQLAYNDNDISASRYSKKPRPDFDLMLARAEAREIDALVAYSNGRFTRRPLEVERLIDLHDRLGIKIKTVVSGDDDLSTADGRMVARIKGNVDAAESDRISERVKAAKAQSARSGAWSGGPRPFGFEKDGVSIRPDERDVLLFMADRLILGDSYRSIALDLNEKKITTSQGRGWSALRVESQIFRPRNFGVRHHLGHDYPAEWPAIYDAETAAKLYVARAARSAVRNSHGTGRKYLLKGFLVCGICGNGLTIYSCQQRNKTYIPAVACRTRDEVPGIKGCGGVKRNLPPIDYLITEAVLYRLDSDAMSALLRRGDDKNVSAYLAQQGAQQTRLDEVLDLYAKGELDLAEYRAAKATAQGELERLTRLVDRAAVGSPLAGLNGKSIREVWDERGLDFKRQVINLLIDRIEVLPQHDRSRHAPKFGPNGEWKFDASLIVPRWKG